jgi:hypothetical protein
LQYHIAAIHAKVAIVRVRVAAVPLVNILAETKSALTDVNFRTKLGEKIKGKQVIKRPTKSTLYEMSASACVIRVVSSNEL